MKKTALILFIMYVFLLPHTAFSATYEIVVRNRANQALTTSVCAIHTKAASLFTTGEAASEGLATLAEDGSTGAFLTEVQATDGILSTTRGDFVSPKGRSTITINGPRRGRRVSCVLGMLIATNDGFPAITARRLPRKVGKRVRFKAFAYDAGSEVNTESCEHVPGGPCDAHFIGEEENGTIQRHPGIQGIADLSVENHGWPEPAVRGIIRRTK